MIANAEKDVSESGLDIKQIQRGGRNNGIRIIQSFKFDTYNNRDMLCYESSRVSPHLKFGTLSCREVYHECSVKNGVSGVKGTKGASGTKGAQIPSGTAKGSSGSAKGPKEASGVAKGPKRPSINLFRKQLYWRDFYMQIGYHFPHVFKGNFKNDKIKWSNNKKYFDAWCSGETGFDIVDACMHQLNTTGYMHNRGRMIVSNFLTKLLGVDWRWGEKYFATKLTDYDPCNNNGGWQWSAGTGADAQPYYRIFNPTLQQKKFDPDDEYIAKWLKSNRNIKPIINYEIARTKYLNNIKK
jgi:deoxyribodipyrimidine photolyase